MATAATIGIVAMGEIDKNKYNESLFLGTLAAGGTLGILIPPSINMIIYGVMTDTSVPKLYLGGFIPGFILTVLFSLAVLIACLWRPEWGGRKVQTSWPERMRTLPDLLPPLVLLMIVIGAIFFGIATATELAAVGIVGALAITAWRRRLSWRMLRDVCEATVRTTAMVVAILVGAFFLNVIIQTIGLTQQLSKLITQYQLTPVQVLSAVIVLYLVLGTFMEELSMMISTIPITTPLVVQAGYDPVWYGVLIVLLIQTAMVTPPFGINLFVIHGIRGRGRLTDVERGSAPFVVALLIMIAMICIWPDIVVLPAALARVTCPDRGPPRPFRDRMKRAWRPAVPTAALKRDTMFPAPSRSARAPGGTTQVKSYSSTISGPARPPARSARPSTGVSSQPWASPK